MTAEIVTLGKEVVGGGWTLNPDKVLESAKGKLTHCIVIGYDEHGELYTAATHDANQTVFMLEQAKVWLVRGCPAE